METAADNKPPLTDRQREIYDFIAERIASNGYPPTIREIGAHLGIRSTNGVADHLKALKRKGWLSQAATKSRTWLPLGKPKKAPEAVSAAPEGRPGTVPVPVLGKVAAGRPILAEERPEGTLHVDPALLPRGAQVFALNVCGDSMIEAGILNGDVLFVQKRAEAPQGSIVVAMIDDEATVKRFYHDGDRILLQPANAAMQTLVVRESDGRQVRVMGVVVGVFRRFS